MGQVRTEELVLNIGPQHPSTHGVFRIVANFEGEILTKLEPRIGYLHRGTEKLAENRTYPQIIPYTNRLDYLSSPHTSIAFAQAVEKLMGLQIPERAEYLRVIFAELARISSHLVFIGSMAMDVAGITAWGYCFRDRERILDMFQMVGGRLLVHPIRIGGFYQDVPSEFWPALQSFLDDLPAMLEEYYGIFYGNEIAKSRLKNVGIVTKELAEEFSITGPVLRAAGVKYDVRKVEPYGIYDRFDFDIPVLHGCDAYDRALVRYEEIKESAKILRQAMRDIPEGPVMAKVKKVIRPPAGEVYHRVENPKGELGIYIVSDGSNKPVRVHFRTPSFFNIQLLPEIAVGWKMQDIIAMFGSLDTVMGEVDK